jgi:hypothetical protein
LIVFGDRPAHRRRHHGVLIVGEMKALNAKRGERDTFRLQPAD